MNRIFRHIQESTAAGMLAVWETGTGSRFEVGRSLSGYHAFRYCGMRLIVHHAGMTIEEVSNLVAGWINETKD